MDIIDENNVDLFQSPKGRLQTIIHTLGLESVSEVSIPNGKATNLPIDDWMIIVEACFNPQREGYKPRR
ncbi:hypothetical protein Calla_2421 [Caldicellulosiruptor acetigenus 6A]|uniref:Uncharacterized protein n=1 Tax=Caldicellulosiruptor acetigenus 6A TaxID=632516 RepID=G2PYM8_9FIRM|nr:hypothetical protein [Caldicellulosiruptor acetigenus]AEM74947.1 hypothetical protein Calla_2421 [Caldicellulosiruptor acetigenus 6A]